MQAWVTRLHWWEFLVRREDVLVCPFTIPHITVAGSSRYGLSIWASPYYKCQAKAESNSCRLWEGAWALVVGRFMSTPTALLWETGKWRCRHERADSGRTGTGKDGQFHFRHNMWGVYQATLFGVEIPHLFVWLFNSFLPHRLLEDGDFVSSNTIFIATILPSTWYNV